MSISFSKLLLCFPLEYIKLSILKLFNILYILCLKPLSIIQSYTILKGNKSLGEANL
jgi:hypothetical protein